MAIQTGCDSDGQQIRRRPVSKVAIQTGGESDRQRTWSVSWLDSVNLPTHTIGSYSAHFWAETSDTYAKPDILASPMLGLLEVGSAAQISKSGDSDGWRFRRSANLVP